MKHGYLLYFEGRAMFMDNVNNLPSNVYQTIHSSEKRINDLLNMTSKELEEEYPSMINKLREKMNAKLERIIYDDYLSMNNSLDLYNEE